MDKQYYKYQLINHTQKQILYYNTIEFMLYVMPEDEFKVIDTKQKGNSLIPNNYGYSEKYL